MTKLENGKIARCYRITPEIEMKISELSNKLGVSVNSVFEMLLTEYYKHDAKTKA